MKNYILLAIICMFINVNAVIAAEGVGEIEKPPGNATQVIRSENSITGYEVKFCFPNQGYKRVRIEGEWVFTDPIHASPSTSLQATPYEWEDGMFPIHNAKKTYDMTLNKETDTWEMTLPLPNGTFCYTFFIDGAEGAAITDYTDAVRAWDPNNPPYGAGNETDYDKMLQYSNRFFQSAVYVPRDEEKQMLTADHTLEAPRTDDKTGTVQFLKIFVNNDVGEQPYGLYLPDNFDENRYRKYPVLFLAHGRGNDESQWFTAGGAAHILDNLMAQKRIDPMVVVTINETKQCSEDGKSWDFPNIMLTVDRILEEMIENYNVSPKISQHAFSGLSLGAMTTAYAMYSRTESFDYFGFMSGGYTILSTIAPEVKDMDYGSELLQEKHILLSAGTSDPALYGDISAFQKNLSSAGTPFISKLIQGGHDWDYWNQALAWELEHFIWK